MQLTLVDGDNILTTYSRSTGDSPVEKSLLKFVLSFSMHNVMGYLLRVELLIISIGLELFSILFSNQIAAFLYQ